jgi:hypothetical protein
MLRNRKARHRSIAMVIVDIAHGLVEVAYPIEEEGWRGSKPATNK